MRSIFALAMVGLAACSSAGAPEGAAATSSPIQGGALELGHPAVGLLVYTDGNYCTAELIAPNVLLTAGHCISQVEAFYTDAKGAPTVGHIPGFVRHAVRRVAAHPSYVANDFDCPNRTLDVALVELSAPLDVTPMDYAKSAADLPAIGTKLGAVGYGVHNEDGGEPVYNQKRSATEKLAGMDASSLHVVAETGLVDHGDSGGPLLYGNTVIGTASCLTDGASYGRVDKAAAWIARTVDSWRARSTTVATPSTPTSGTISSSRENAPMSVSRARDNVDRARLRRRAFSDAGSPVPRDPCRDPPARVPARAKTNPQRR